jgi:hypothetical protein
VTFARAHAALLCRPALVDVLKRHLLVARQSANSMSMNLDLDALKSGLGLLTDVLNAVKGLRDLLPKGKERDQIESKVADAEKQFAIAESEIAFIARIPALPVYVPTAKLC